MSVVDTATGEIIDVSSVALAIPRPHEVTSAIAVCESIEAALPTLDDPAALWDGRAKLLAIESYLARTTKVGAARLEATARRIEIRVGEVLGEPEPGKRTDLSGAQDRSLLRRQEVHELRLLASHRDLVERVLADSDDSKPASRRKCLDAIRDHLAAQRKDSEMPTATGNRVDQIRDLAKVGMTGPEIAEHLGISAKRVSSVAVAAGIVVPGSAAAVAQRWARVAELAAQGYTSRQIAAEVGMQADNVRSGARERGIDIPADAIVGGTRLLDSTRIVRASVEAVDGIGILFDQIDYTALDPEDVNGWLPILNASIESLQTLRNALRKVSQP